MSLLALPGLRRRPAAASEGSRRPIGRWRVGFLSQAEGVWGLMLTASVLLLVLVGPWLAPSSPIDFIGAPFEAPSAQAWLGTDVVGRDVLSRVLCGGTTILSMSALATLFGVAAGGLLGVAAGYLGGLLDDVIMRLLDVLLAFPQMILALLFVSVLGSNVWLVAALVAALHAPQVARVIRAATLRVAGEDFVRFARAIGTPRLVVMVTEILPNVSGPLLVETSLRFTYSIALIAGLSFLGLAQAPPAANWGLMVNENRIGLMENPWPVLVPIGLVAILTVGINLLTDAYGRHAAGRNREQTAVDVAPAKAPDEETLLSSDRLGVPL